MTLYVRDCVIGDVYLIDCNANEIANPKAKMCICIHPNQFFLINTEAMPTDNLVILQKEHRFLTYDSNVNCGITLEFKNNREVIKRDGSISTNLLEGIIDVVEDAKILTPIEKRQILSSLRALQIKRNKP